jgi:hypothetical protein
VQILEAGSLGWLLKIVEEERKKLPARTSSEVPLAEVQQAEHVELEQSEGSVEG